MAAASAARGGSWEVLQELLAHATTCDMHVDRSKLVPILAEGGRIKVLRCLLHRDGDPALQDILHATAEQDWPAVLGLVQQQDRGLPASLLLQYAVDHIGSAGLQALLQGSAVTVGNAPETETAFIAAARYGNLQCLQVLREHGLGSTNPAVVTAAVQGGHYRCVELLLPLIPQHLWRVDGLRTAAAHGYWRILGLLLEQQDMLSPESGVLSSQLSIAFSSAACRGHLQCARLLVDRIVQAYNDDKRASGHERSIQEVNASLAAAARAGDWQMVELITSRSWPDDIADITKPHHLRLAPDISGALHALLNPTMRCDVDRHLQTLHPVTQPKPQGGSAAGSCGGQQGQRNTGAGTSDTTGAGVSDRTGAGSSGSPGRISDASGAHAHASDSCSDARESHIEVEVEVEEVDEAEVPSLQQYPPSRSKAAVLLLRAGALIITSDGHGQLLALAEKAGNEELKELLRDFRPPA
jgi:hypothetical protein